MFSDWGILKTYRHMDGFGSHTFSLINTQDDTLSESLRERVWCKFHFKTLQGHQTLTEEESAKIKGEDPDHATHDLFEVIAKKDYPKWRMCIQVMTEIPS